MPPTSSPEARGAAGFTLLEMLVALSIGLMLTAAAAGMLPGGAGSLSAGVRTIVTELREARHTALATGRDQVVTFDFANRTLHRAPDDLVSLPASVEIAFDQTEGVRDITREPQIVFFAGGGSTGGMLAVSRGETRHRVEVRWLTGAVSHD